jgi:hypothetical protein
MGPSALVMMYNVVIVVSVINIQIGLIGPIYLIINIIQTGHYHISHTLYIT